MVTLQRLAHQRKLTLVEAKEVILTQKDLSMEEQCWLEQACNLVSIMPPPTLAEQWSYDLSSYPPKLIPLPGALPAPLMLTSSTCPLMLTSLTANPLSVSTMPHQPAIGPSTLTTPTFCLPHLPNLIHTIFQSDPSPTPNSSSQYQLAMRHPLSATPMGQPCTIARSGDNATVLPPHPTTPH